MKILVTGATGYVGSRLIPELLRAGHTVRAADIGDEAAQPWWSDRVETVVMDALDEDAVDRAVAGVDAVYYLIHGMGGDDFAARDHEAAEHMVAAVDRHGVGRVVYLSGIVPDVPVDDLSAHIASRLDVEETLATSAAVTIALRAAILLGSGSTSFEVVRQISERMPVQTVPAWMNSTVQPIAVVDALQALAGALTVDSDSRHYDVGGPSRLTYADLLDTYATVARLKRVQVGVPLVPERLVAVLAGRIVDVPTAVVESLVESLQHDMVCADDEFHELLPDGYELVGLEEAIRRSLVDPPADPESADPMAPLPQDPPWAGGGEDDSFGSKVAGLVSRVLPERDRG